MKNITKLSVFDFDGTLVNTPLPDTGRQIYQDKTGQVWPHKGWWGQADSLDMKVFDMPSNPSVIAAYKAEKANPQTGVIMLTGRLQKLGGFVKNILDSKGLTFDGYYYNTGCSTDYAKKKTMDKLLAEFPNIEVIEMWDDRLEHIPIFQEWGDEKVSQGILKDFKINVVVSENHK
jgi:hypothetical protein